MTFKFVKFESQIAVRKAPEQSSSTSSPTSPARNTPFWRHFRDNMRYAMLEPETRVNAVISAGERSGILNGEMGRFTMRFRDLFGAEQDFPEFIKR